MSGTTKMINRAYGPIAKKSGVVKKKKKTISSIDRTAKKRAMQNKKSHVDKQVGKRLPRAVAMRGSKNIQNGRAFSRKY